MRSPDDLTTAARIRDAALRLFAEQGFPATTIRQVATQAGVSPALVMHHYGSKDGLRAAVDGWFVEVLRRDENAILTSGQPIQIAAHIAEHPEYAPIVGYLTASLREGGAVADRIFDLVVDVTRDVITHSVDAGVMNAPTDVDATAAILASYACGAQMLSSQLARHLGGDDLLSPAVYERYSLSSYEMFAGSLFTEKAGYLVGGSVANPTTEGNPA